MNDPMKIRKSKTESVRTCAACALAAAFCFAAFAGPSKPPAPAQTTAAEPEIPHSVFTLPTNVKDGKDPFFPTSVRLWTTRAATPAKAAFDASTLALNGIIPRVSGMINGKTFYKGDEADVKDSAGARIRVKCLEVKEDSVLIEAGGERRELHLRRGVF